MQKHIEQIDRKTGEVMQGCMVYLPYRPKLTERWFMAFQDTFIEIAKDQDLTLEPKNVLFYLFGKLDFENFIQQTQAEIAEALGMQKKPRFQSHEATNRKANRPRRPQGRKVEVLPPEPQLRMERQG